MNKKSEGFHFVYQTEEDVKNERLKIIPELTEEQISEFVFNSENLYKIGTGHSFGQGFYVEYITKSGIVARNFHGEWFINDDSYNYINNSFVKNDKIEYKPQPFELKTIALPVVSTKIKTIANDLISIIPIG